MPVTGVLLFAVPKASETVQIIWVMISYNLFYSFAYTIYNMSHALMVPLSTRATEQRGSLSVFNNVASVMVSGIIVALVFPMVVMPMLGVNKELWLLTMSILAILTLPLTLLEYFYTKERVTQESSDKEIVRPLKVLLQLCSGSYNDGITQTMASVIGGIPMRIGIFAVCPGSY